ncbi:hypothetical protein GNP44_19055 [Aliivibrio fischeri]|uniref:hypothetical protein n=1 Tax=Aliivibrio fischeri TaxID=668 RepID=UPI0012D8818A|nr:hypothetical protein [Aliivibrio fischeri]MUK32169.1 hypothetical protein [Aliivibrio fischeri]
MRKRGFMKYIGKYGEHLVLSQLLKRNIEAYLAIKSNQEDYDITVITDNKSVKRVQVKATELHNKNTNNSITGIEKDYDYLVLVVIEPKIDHIYIMSREDALTVKGNSKKFSCSYSDNLVSKIKSELEVYKDNWFTIESA